VFDDVRGLQLQKTSIASGKQLPVVVLRNTSGVTIKDLHLPVKDKKAILHTGSQ
jgi:hypothetical protein